MDFHGNQESTEETHSFSLSHLGSLLVITTLHEFSMLEQVDTPARYIPIRVLVSKIWLGTGILTCFPFDIPD